LVRSAIKDHTESFLFLELFEMLLQELDSNGFVDHLNLQVVLELNTDLML
jgi:hypothetical protein